MYGISPTTFWRYRKAWLEELDRAARRYVIKGRTVKKLGLTRDQIKIIVALMGDPPEGYKLVRGVLVKLNER